MCRNRWNQATHTVPFKYKIFIHIPKQHFHILSDSPRVHRWLKISQDYVPWLWDQNEATTSSSSCHLKPLWWVSPPPLPISSQIGSSRISVSRNHQSQTEFMATQSFKQHQSHQGLASPSAWLGGGSIRSLNPSLSRGSLAMSWLQKSQDNWWIIKSMK